MHPDRWCFEKETVEAFMDALVCLEMEMGLEGRIEETQAARWAVGCELEAQGDDRLARLGRM